MLYTSSWPGTSGITLPLPYVHIQIYEASVRPGIVLQIRVAMLQVSTTAPVQGGKSVVLCKQAMRQVITIHTGRREEMELVPDQ